MTVVLIVNYKILISRMIRTKWQLFFIPIAQHWNATNDAFVKGTIDVQ